MMWVRGHSADYDGWSALGVRGWAWSDVVLQVVLCPVNDADEVIFAGMCEVIGDAVVADGSRVGVGRGLFSERNGERWSTVSAYLRLALLRKNLCIESRVLVSQVLIEK